MKGKRMNTEGTGPRSLREIEEEVLAEGREWTRQRLQQRLQEEAQRHGEVFPPQRPAAGASAPASHATAHGRRSPSNWKFCTAKTRSMNIGAVPSASIGV